MALPCSLAWQDSLEEQDLQALDRVVFTQALPLPSFMTIPSSVAMLATRGLHTYLFQYVKPDPLARILY
jgi:hypothetical protein